MDGVFLLMAFEFCVQAVHDMHLTQRIMQQKAGKKCNPIFHNLNKAKISCNVREGKRVILFKDTLIILPVNGLQQPWPKCEFKAFAENAYMTDAMSGKFVDLQLY